MTESFNQKLEKIRKHNPDYLELGKIPPQDIDIEMKILGGIINDPTLLIHIVTFLHPNHFYREEHKVIFNFIIQLLNDSMPINISMLTSEIRRKNKLEEVGGAYNLVQLTDYLVNSPKEVTIYAIRIIECYTRRELIRICSQTIEDAYDESSETFKVIEDVLELIETLDYRSQFKENLQTTVGKLRTKLKLIHEGTEDPYMMISGKALSRMLKISKNKIFLFGATRKVGKTKFMVWLIKQLIINYGICANWHSYEMSKEEMIIELCSSITGIEANRLRGEKYDNDGNPIPPLTEEEIDIKEMALDKIEKMKIEFNSTTLPIEDISLQFRTFAKRNSTHLPVLVIDPLGGVANSDKKKSQTENESHIAKQMIKLREDTQGIIFINHHLNKEVTEKDNKETGFWPMIDHLRGSGNTSDFANTIVLLYRPAIYPLILSEEYQKRPDLIETKDGKTWHPAENLFCVDIQATRHGVTGVVRFMCDLGVNDFKEWTNTKIRKHKKPE